MAGLVLGGSRMGWNRGEFVVKMVGKGPESSRQKYSSRIGTKSG